MTTSQYSIVRNTYDGQKVESPLNFNMGEEIIPRYPSLGYDALTHGRAGNGLGYYNVAGAYPSFAGSCTRYGKRVCSGLVEGASTFPNGHPPNLRSALFQDSGPAALRKAGYNRDQYPRTAQTDNSNAPDLQNKTPTKEKFSEIKDATGNMVINKLNCAHLWKAPTLLACQGLAGTARSPSTLVPPPASDCMIQYGCSGYGLYGFPCNGVDWAVGGPDSPAPYCMEEHHTHLM